jgi:hypothetical protein
VDEGEVSTRLMFSKWDWMQLDRLVGTKNARKMVTIGAESMFTFCCCLEEEKRRQEKTGQRSRRMRTLSGWPRRGRARSQSLSCE